MKRSSISYLSVGFTCSTLALSLLFGACELTQESEEEHNFLFGDKKVTKKQNVNLESDDKVNDVNDSVRAFIEQYKASRDKEEKAETSAETNPPVQQSPRVDTSDKPRVRDTHNIQPRSINHLPEQQDPNDVAWEGHGHQSKTKVRVSHMGVSTGEQPVNPGRKSIHETETKVKTEDINNPAWESSYEARNQAFKKQQEASQAQATGSGNTNIETVQANSEVKITPASTDSKLPEAEAFKDAPLSTFFKTAMHRATNDKTPLLTAQELAYLSEDDRKVMTAWMKTMKKLTDDELDKSKLVKASEKLIEQMQVNKPFSLKNFKLCSEVRGYGNYIEMDGTKLVFGRRHPMIVYVECENFDSTLNDGRYSTFLKMKVTLHNSFDGATIWADKEVKITDHSKNKRRDFYVLKVIHLTEKLNPGKYKLKIRITDLKRNQVDEMVTPIRILAEQHFAGGN